MIYNNTPAPPAARVAGPVARKDQRWFFDLRKGRFAVAAPRAAALRGLGSVDSEVGAFFDNSGGGSSWDWGQFFNNAGAGLNFTAKAVDAYAQAKAAAAASKLIPAPATSPAPAAAAKAPAAAAGSGGVSAPVLLGAGVLALLLLKR